MYVASGVAELLGGEVRMVRPDEMAGAIDESVAVVALSEVNYRTARRYDMRAMTRAVQDVGALMLWDLCHSAGVMEIALNDCNADYAVGCGYKYLNGGPGAPSYSFVAKRHQADLRQPLTGWHGHAAPFAFVDDYAPAAGMARLRCGTSPQLSLIALEAALEAFDGVDLKAVRARSEQLTSLFIDLFDAHLVSRGFGLVTPREVERRGSQVSIAHAEAYAIMQALLAKGVIGDLRAPDVLRFGLAPMYVRCVDVFDTVAALVEIVDGRVYERAEYRQPGKVI
jgi:kynureninase